MGVSYSGASGGKYGSNGEAFPKRNFTVYDLSSSKYGFSNDPVDGGAKGTGRNAGGGGGGSSLFSVGGDGGDSTSTSSPPPPGIGAGGGGGGARSIDSLNDGSRGGIARAIVYFGYY